MINGLPKWSIPDLHPAFFDTESATAIEMVAKLYGKIKEIVEGFNDFTEEFHNYGAEIINELINSGKFTVGVTYDEATESLNIIFTGGDK